MEVSPSKHLLLVTNTATAQDDQTRNGTICTSNEQPRPFATVTDLHLEEHQHLEQELTGSVHHSPITEVMDVTAVVNTAQTCNGNAESEHTDETIRTPGATGTSVSFAECANFR
jgi:hypothetical protein